MEPQGWISPSAYDSSAATAPPPVAAYDLRPLAVGEILDRVLSIYRRHFWLLAGLSAVSASVSLIISILRLIYLHFSVVKLVSPSYSLIIGAFAMVQGILYLAAYSFTLAATTSAVNSIYLGEATSMVTALQTARRLWLRCLGVAVWQTWSAVWVFIFLALPFVFLPGAARSTAVLLGILLFVGFLAGAVYGVIAYLRNSLAVPAAVIEDIGVRTAMRRSKRLASGRVGRILLLLLLVYALWMVAAVIQTPLAFLLLRSHAAQQLVLQGMVLAVNFVATTLVGPIAAIGFCLFYFDERVRREGFDIEILLRGASASSSLDGLPLSPAPIEESPGTAPANEEQT